MFLHTKKAGAQPMPSCKMLWSDVIPEKDQG